MFSKGQVVFVIFFIVVFAAGLIWSYRKEAKIRQIHFKKSYKVLIVLVLFIILQFIIVKIRKFL